MRALKRGLIGGLAIAVSLGGCSRSDFGTETREGFATDCQTMATDIAGKIGVEPGIGANLFKVFVDGVGNAEIARRFDPARPPDVAGNWILTQSDEDLSVCTSLESARDRFSGVSRWTVFDGAASNWLAALQAQMSEVNSLRQRIKDTIAGRVAVSGKIADLIGRFAPRGIAYTPIQKGARMVPSVTIRAVNVLDVPIDGFFWSIDLKRPDGSTLASGRFSFRPPAPLGPGVEADYHIPLDNIAGFGDPRLGDIRSMVRVKVKTEDVIAGGERLLRDSIVDSQDEPRVEALGVMEGRIRDMEDYVERLRVRAEAAR